MRATSGQGILPASTTKSSGMEWKHSREGWSGGRGYGESKAFAKPQVPRSLTSLCVLKAGDGITKRNGLSG